MKKEGYIVSVDDPTKAFWFCNGFIAHNLKEAVYALKRSDQASFKHHVNQDKNDIAKWIEEVLNDKKLAKQLFRVKTQKTTINKIEKRIKELKL